MNTKEFAGLCGIEKRTLFHYDEIGILKPSRVHANGYRDYDPAQVEQMDMIKLLQASCYSLREIKEMQAIPIEKRREKFFSAADLMEQKIASLQTMRNYIRKREELWRQYQAWKTSGRRFVIEPLHIVYQQKEIDAMNHYFCFLNDGDYDGIVMNDDHRMFLCREDERGISKSGDAIRFFLEAANSITDMVSVIQSQLVSFGFRGDNQFFLHPIPHLLLNNPQQGVLRITVFSI